ncbi:MULTISPECIES: histidine phosphatase family protein [unclassified Polaromonas]|jgi:phosphohistidine phosphatase|uniref:SixA phosphatase family protein n=1 Tax=unclassified Polaromonas TaxID=2638319 RepID=UPI000BDD7AB9|nr:MULTISPECIES: histidine phosphatase family protein [unclassified Polaromonas]OYY37029.1 MAG: histidine phosphatase family protein [Polaromonas sp. 35-63-35]OYZ20649.1 MAG: histidine phosphatase family protein [Polaromonas sp. 16-63-31]OYZ78789.1 MAG: histidine phosphatase family protein [Polaromonas sp. 24-63-21]OZA49699.1 MAG: histidine phosphatase family protein [Polaromonas sp. 17-63-33]OZA89132.1 MAG: histidine phosphatase family protein [Polaromonas sp. 39-63-25]
MDLILWRHAEAEESPADAQGGNDLERSLTPRGEKQAARMAAWLDRQLPERARILVSPARRCEQTALALGRKYKIRAELGPDAPPSQLLELVQWPVNKLPILVIGHQPTLGQTIAQLLGLQESECAVKKGALWWLRTREREEGLQTVVVTVQSPELL